MPMNSAVMLFQVATSENREADLRGSNVNPKPQVVESVLEARDDLFLYP
jgi:hypothetical protein